MQKTPSKKIETTLVPADSKSGPRKPTQSTKQIFSSFAKTTQASSIQSLVAQTNGRCTDDIFVNSAGTSVPGRRISQQRLGAFLQFNELMQVKPDIQLRVPTNTPGVTGSNTPEPSSPSTPKK